MIHVSRRAISQHSIYDFGYNEWYFAIEEDLERFLAFVPHISRGEDYPA